MHPTLELIKKELEGIAASVISAMPNNEPLNVAHQNWSFPGITRDELAQTATSLIQSIDFHSEDEVNLNATLLADYVRRLTFLRTNTIAQIWGSSVQAVPAYLTTLSGLKNALEEAFENNKDAETIEVERIKAVKKIRALQTSLRTIEGRITVLDSRSANLDEKVERIEHAHEAADQLPTDLETLKESRTTIENLLRDSAGDGAEVKTILSEINGIREKLDKSDKEATAIVERCDAAYRATTSEGLASAFAERSRALNFEVYCQ